MYGTNDRCNLLFYAVQQFKSRAVKYLLGNGADVNLVVFTNGLKMSCHMHHTTFIISTDMKYKQVTDSCFLNSGLRGHIKS